MKKIALKRLKDLRELGVSSASFNENGDLESVAFYRLPPKDPQKAVEEFVKLEKEEEAERRDLQKLIYGHVL